MPLRDCVKLMLACGLIQIAAYYFAGSLASPGDSVAVPQPDTLLYCQSAKQIAEGMPFVYTPGDKPSTGNTTHLYPFLLAALYKAGAHGDALLTAGFALNALFYLIFLANWGIIAGRLLPTPLSRNAACALLALNGQAAFGALSQSDVGLFMAVSSGVFAALLSERKRWFAGLMVLAPWCRPEGVMFAVLFAVVLAGRRWLFRERLSRQEILTAGAALLSSLGVFALNYGLTGYTQFQSVFYKGYFKSYGLISAVYLTVSDMVRMGRELFLGEPVLPPREIFFLPLLGALFAWVGVLTRTWTRKSTWKETWWLMASVGGVAVVASSGWQNTNMDRYLVWLLPIWLVYMAAGVVWVGQRLPERSCRVLPFLTVAAFQALGAVWMASIYYSSGLITHQNYAFMQDADKLLPPKASLGAETASFAYAFPGRRVVHLAGIYTPDMLAPWVIDNLERLKHQPSLRFDYWAFEKNKVSAGNVDVEALCGPAVTVGLGGWSIRKAFWGSLDRGCLPLGDETLKQLEGWKLADRLDVGYPEDEKRCGYSEYSRFHGAKYLPFGQVGTVGTNEVLEVGRPVLGAASMTIGVRPGFPVRVVLRTQAKASSSVKMGAGSFMPQDFTFNSPLKLRVDVDGKQVGLFQLEIPCGEKVFSEVVLTLPAESIRKEALPITIYGDHAALCYWFYQPK